MPRGAAKKKNQLKKNESMKTTELFSLPPPPHPPAGYLETDHRGSGSRLQNAVSRAGSLLWMVVTSPGGCGLLCARSSVFSGSYFRPSFCGWASNSVTETVAPLGEACSRIIAGSREPREHPCLEAGWRALAARAGGWDDGNWEAWDRTEVHWLSGLGSGQGGPRGETCKPMVQGGTWAPRALFQAGSSGSSIGGSAPPGTA